MSENTGFDSDITRAWQVSRWVCWYGRSKDAAQSGTRPHLTRARIHAHTHALLYAIAASTIFFYLIYYFVRHAAQFPRLGCPHLRGGVWPAAGWVNEANESGGSSFVCTTNPKGGHSFICITKERFTICHVLQAT